MTSVEEQLPALLRKAAPMSVGVDVAEVLRLGRNVQRRRRLANVASVVIVSVGVGSRATVIASSGHPQNATVSPRPVTGAPVITTLTPASASPSAADLRADAAVLTRRLTASGFSGQVHVGVGYIALNLPSSAAGSVKYLASTGRLSFRVPAAVEQAPTKSSVAASSCVSASGPASGSPPPCISARLYASCPKSGTVEGRQVAAAPATNWIVACDTTGTTEYALSPQRLGADAVANAAASIRTGTDGTSTDNWNVSVNFTPSGQSEWADLTAAISSAPGCPASSSASCVLAVVVDGVVQSAPVIQGRIAGSAEITGSFTEQSAKALAAALTLPMPVGLGHS
jgi:preprotein translocase subunit SecD